jgi:hypothetical protein
MGVGRMSRITAVCLAVGAVVAVESAPGVAARKRAATSSSCNPSQTILGAESPGPEVGAPTALSGGMDPAILGRFAVLRRAAGPADQLPLLNPIDFQLDIELGSYYPAYIRQLAQLPDGSRVFLVPGFRRAAAVPAARCLPKQLRSQRKKLVEQQLKRATEPVYCVGEIGPRSRPLANAGCRPFADIETGAALAATRFSGFPVTDIVPDGVARVRLIYSDGNAVAAPVSENAYTFTPPRASVGRVKALLGRLMQGIHRGHLTKRQRQRQEEALFKLILHALRRLSPTRVQWLDGGGNVLRSFTPRRASSNNIVFVSGSSSSSIAVG